MKSRFFTIVTPLIMLLFFVLGITPVFSAIPPVYSSAELTNRLKTGAYLQKTDNLLIIVDGLGKTFLGVGEPQSQKVARSLISNIGKTIPNIPHRRMLRVHGPKADRFEKDFSTIFGLYHKDAKGFTPIIATKTHAISDFDPLGMTFISATQDLRKLNGSHAVVLISDGINIPKSAIYESAYMKKKFRGSVCYYPILVGNDPQGAKNMNAIAKIGGCGFLAQYGAVDSPAELADYVEKIFFSKRRMPVKPVEVVEPEPEPLPVEEPLEPVMVDTEEVTEIVEEPAIPEIIEDEFVEEIAVIDDDIIILERQLPHDKVVTIELHVEFDLNMATLRPGYEEEIKKIADFMTLYPETEALLEGHTCDLGSEIYNQQLSSRRAATVKNYLADKFGIDPQRLKTRGAGEIEPIADNSTEEGREQNRRVMAVISTIVTDYVIIEQEILKSDFLSDDFILPPVDQIVDEMMQEEFIDEPQGVEMPEGGDDMTAPATHPMVMDEAPEVTSEVDAPEASGLAETTTMEESVPTTEEAVPAPPEQQEEPAAIAEAVAEQEAAVDAAFDVQEEPTEQLNPQPQAASAAVEGPAETMESPAREETAPTLPAEEVPAAETSPTVVDEPITAGEEQPISSGSAPQATSPEEEVVVSPGESAFDEEVTAAEIEQIEEAVSEPVSAPEGPADPESVVEGREEEEDSYL